MMVRALVVAALVCASGCTQRQPDPLLIEGNRLTVANQTSSDWTSGEIWLNHDYRVKLRQLAGGWRYRSTTSLTAMGDDFPATGR